MLCEPKSMALRTLSHLAAGTGGFQRRSPTGGAAKGIPRNARTSVMSLPSTVPDTVLTCEDTDADCAFAANAVQKMPNIASNRGSTFMSTIPFDGESYGVDKMLATPQAPDCNGNSGARIEEIKHYNKIMSTAPRQPNAFIRQLPKAELQLLLEGAVAPATLVHLPHPLPDRPTPPSAYPPHPYSAF